jgi:hypothetical protein
MAAKTTLKIKQSAISGRIPSNVPSDPAYIEQGELALNTSDKLLFSKDSSGNIFSIGGTGDNASTINEEEFIATAGQTSFPITGGYLTSDYCEVYVNGIKLQNSIDFTYTDGTNLVLSEASELDDEITVIMIGPIALTNVEWTGLQNKPAVITNIQAELDAKVDDAQVLTDVPVNAVFTDTETTTSLSVAANILKYTDEVGTETNIDLSLYIDDTNAAYISSGTLNSTTGIATFTRSDATSFDVDMSSFFDDTVLSDADIAAMGYIKVDTNTQLSDTDIAAMGYIKVDTNTQLSDADIAAMGYIKVDTQVTVNNTLTSTSTTQALSAKQGKVLQDSKVDNSRVLTDVPINALFTDTTYTKPASEPISYIDGLQSELDEKATMNDVISLAIALG